MAYPNITLVDIRNYVRIIMAEPQNAQRWSDPNLNYIINQVHSRVSTDLKWPESTITVPAVSGQQEYGLAPFMQVLRVYCGGQRLVPTDIPELEGDQIELYDQTAANFTPQWRTQAASAYPVGSDTGFAQPPVPWFPGMRPRFYLRGGGNSFNLGLVPAPLGTPTITVDLVPIPAQLVLDTDVSPFPAHALSCLTYGTIEECFRADDKDDRALRARELYENEMGKLRDWRDGLQKDRPREAYPITYRSFNPAFTPDSTFVNRNVN